RRRSRYSDNYRHRCRRGRRDDAGLRAARTTTRSQGASDGTVHRRLPAERGNGRAAGVQENGRTGAYRMAGTRRAGLPRMPRRRTGQRSLRLLHQGRRRGSRRNRGVRSDPVRQQGRARPHQRAGHERSASGQHGMRRH
ncbi:hypothetical protein OY671_011793, partial [Metschnikowia pulcherrima]